MPPRQINLCLLPLSGAAEFFRNFQQAFCCIRTRVENHILAGRAQFLINAFINSQLTGIDNAHIHARRNGMIEKHRMHRLAHRLVATEGEGKIRDTARHMRMRQGLADGAGRFDKGHAIARMLFNTGGDRKHIRIENNIFGRKADLVHQKMIGP